MRAYLLLVILLQVCQLSSAQVYTVEVMPGNRYLFYQHVFRQKIKENSKVSFVHIANTSNWYQQNPNKGGMGNEIMNQVYISHEVLKNITFLGGLFYTNITGIRPSIAIQFTQTFKNGVFVMVPRADITKNGSTELMAMLEYQPSLTQRIKLYSRLQFMSNSGPDHHNRSYQRVRLGIQIKKFQLGTGVNINHYGYPLKTKINSGIFLRKSF